MRIGIITGSGTYALPDFDAGAPQRGRDAFRRGARDRRALRGRRCRCTSRATARATSGSRSQVAHRANIAALRERGADAILAVTVCGALDPDLELGLAVVFDDLHFLANRLPDGSLCTLHAEPGAPGRGHWIFDLPFSRAAARARCSTARARPATPVRDGGCYGHVDGPRFNTRTEIRALGRRA